MRPDGPAKEADLDRLTQENSRLSARVDRLHRRLAYLDGRVSRLESSIVFRFLRWLGGVLSRVGLLAGPAHPNAAREAEVRYSEWVQEASLRRSLLARLSPNPHHRVDVSAVVDVRRPDPHRLRRTLSSLQSQNSSFREVLVYAPASPPDWFADLCREFSAQPISDSLPSALRECKGQYTAVLSGDPILGPEALDEWIAAADTGAVAVYSDWDFVDAQGRQHTPRFTPEFSPELLSQTLYWGGCYLARTTQAQELLQGPTREITVHKLAIRLGESKGSIVRIARMLWHAQDGAEISHDPARQTEANSGAGEARASLIICSRKSKQLDKSLSRLLPSLDRRHEVIVILHEAGDEAALKRVAARHSVKAIPYRGPFHFGVMNRLGVDNAAGEVLCFLNDDVYPTSAGWIEPMIVQAIRRHVGAVGALLLYPNRTIAHAGIVVGGWVSPAQLGRFQTDSPLWPWLRMTREVTAVSGACMVMRRAVWDELGGFDPRFPVNHNETDLCLRARDRGYSILLETRSVLIHQESRTRIPLLRPEETELFDQIWESVISRPDRFYNPQLDQETESIALPPPWTAIRM